MTDKLKGVLIAVAATAALALGGAAIAGAAGGDSTKSDTGNATISEAAGGDNNESEAGDNNESEAGDSSKPITGNSLDKAKAAALAHTGGGRVTETEVGDEEGAYEVEVVRDDGRQVDVHLDRNFHVLDQSADGDGSKDD